jgi:hypothetical protein
VVPVPINRTKRRNCLIGNIFLAFQMDNITRGAKNRFQRLHNIGRRPIVGMQDGASIIENYVTTTRIMVQQNKGT